MRDRFCFKGVSDSLTYFELKIWPNEEKLQRANNGYGMCNTSAYGCKRVCELGGIGCNVDHKFLKILNETRK